LANILLGIIPVQTVPLLYTFLETSMATFSLPGSLMPYGVHFCKYVFGNFFFSFERTWTIAITVNAFIKAK
jgi:hypothetical protein